MSLSLFTLSWFPLMGKAKGQKFYFDVTVPYYYLSKLKLRERSKTFP